jgi:hypothetical protein
VNTMTRYGREPIQEELPVSFDDAPGDQSVRYLLLHPESMHLFEVFTRVEYDRYTDEDSCVDMTNEPEHEEMFKRMTP